MVLATLFSIVTDTQELRNNERTRKSDQTFPSGQGDHQRGNHYQRGKSIPERTSRLSGEARRQNRGPKEWFQKRNVGVLREQRHWRTCVRTVVRRYLDDVHQN